MSNESATGAENSVSDEYIERLKRKYLTKSSTLDTGSVQSPKTTASSDVESYLDLPANSSLTATEKRHYNRAMREIGKAMKLSRDEHESILDQFKNSIKVTSDTDENKSIHSASADLTSNILEQQADPPITSSKVSPDKQNELSHWEQSPRVTASTSTLPSTIPAGTLKSKSTVTSISLEDAALYWDDESSTFNGLSSKILLDCDNTKPVSLADVRAIYSELTGIYKKIQSEKQKILKQQLIGQKLGTDIIARENQLVSKEACLLKKEKELLERERVLSYAMRDMESCKEIKAKLEGVELEVQEKFESIQQKHKLQIDKMEEMLSSQAMEAKRLKSSFTVLKDQNEELRGKLLASSEECKKVKSQNVKLKKRLENLQRKQDYQATKSDKAFRTSNKENAVEKTNPGQRQSEKSAKIVSTVMETVPVLFDWIVESVFKTKDSSLKADSNSKTIGFTDEFIMDKCLKVLPMFVDILKASTPQPSFKKNQFSYLSFIYHCLRRIDDSQHSILSSTTRRLGDELYKPVVYSQSKEPAGSLILATTAAYSVVDSLAEASQSFQQITTKTCQNLYFRSAIPEVRMLSSFIILKTLHQVDILAHVFGQLKKDLKDDGNRKIFLEYDAIHILMPYMTYKANKALLGDAVDIFMQMAMESVFLPTFLEQCSKEEWFRAFSSAVRELAGSIDKPSFNPDILEKICVILQKLSKMKSNKKYFEAFAIGRSLQECYRCRDPNNTFLSLNLRSILFNLDILKEP